MKDRHDTGSIPSAAGHDYFMEVRNGEGTLIVRYFLYEAPTDLSTVYASGDYCITVERLAGSDAEAEEGIENAEN